MSRFLRFCAILSVFLFSSNAFAGGYYCAIEYTSCAANYYLSNNSCKACSSVSFTDTTYDTCTITNGTGTREATRTCYRTTSSAGSTSSSACTGSANCGSYTYGTCTVETCNTHYHANATNTGCVGDEYTITLNANGGSGGTTAIYTRYNTGVYLDSARTKQMTTLTTSYAITKPTRAGYTFKGYSSSNGATMYIGENGILVFNGLTAGRTATSNSTWYAVWDCNTTCGEKANTTSTQSCSLSCTIDNGTCTYTGCSQTCNGNYTNSSACSSAGATCTGCSSWGTCGGCTKNITCKPGYYLSDGGACEECGGSGYYCPGDNNQHLVSKGYYSTGGNGTTTRTGQTGCEPGNYCSGGVKYACGAGTKNASTGSSSSSACTACAAGTYSTGGASACSTVNDGCYGGAGATKACPNSCSSLNSFYTKSDNGRDANTDCYGTTTSGNYIATEKSGQVTCAAGGYCPGSVKVYYNSTGGRTACSAGTKNASTGSSSSSACTTCAAGTYNTTTGNTSCSTCPAGSYCTGGSNKTACVANSSSAAGSDAISDCSCNAGYSGNAGTSGGTCTACSCGYYKGSAGNTSCTKTSAGYYASGTGNTKQTQATAGNYAAAGACSQTACPSPYSSSAAGSSSNAYCYLTTSSTKYVAETGKGEVTCAAGGYCPGGTKVYYTSGVGSTTGGRTACSAGTKNASTGSSSSSACTTCAAGTYNTTTGNTSCTTCPAGSYCTGGSNKTACTANSSSPAGSDAKADCVCNAGYGGSAESGSCTYCSAGTYKTSAGNTACSTCASGSYCTGGTHIATCSSFNTSYPYSDSGIGSSNYCFASKTNTGSQLECSQPSNSVSYSCGTCSPGTCSYRDYYNATDTTCIPSNCTKPVASATCKAKFYGTTSCTSCPSDYPNSDQGTTSSSYCYTSCATGYSGRNYNGATDTCAANCNPITLNANGGTAGSIAKLYKKTGSGTWYTNSTCTTTYSTTNDVVPTRSGYTFRGFYSGDLSDVTSDNSSGTQYITKNGASSTSGTNWTVTGESTIYAAWAKNCTKPSTGSCSLSVSDAGVVDYTTSCNTGYTISNNNTATPSCAANTLTIILNKNGGSGTCGGATSTTAGSMTCTYDGACAVPTWNSTSCNITNGTKILTGWNTKADGTGDKYALGASIKNIIPSGSTTLYAVWTAPTCSKGSHVSLGYALNASNNTPSCRYQCTIGYSVSGGTDTTNQFDQSGTANTTTVTGSQCKARTSVVSFNANGGSGGQSANVTATYGSAMPGISATPTQAACKFKGYYDATTDGTQYYNAAGNSARTWNKLADTTLYAQWDCYTVAATNVNLTYNGSAQSCKPNLSFVGLDATSTLTYAEGLNGTSFSSTAPTITNAGSKTVRVKISVDGYGDKIVNASCVMAQATGSTTIKSGSTTVSSGSVTYPNSKSLTVSCAGGATPSTSVTNSNSGVALATISGTTLTLTPVKAGETVVTVSCPATTNYKASSATYTLTVNRGTCTITLNPTSVTLVYPTTSKTVAIDKGSCNGTISAISSATGVATVSLNAAKTQATVTYVADGSATLIVSSAQSDQYNAATASASITTTKGTITATVAGNSKNYDGTALTCNGGISSLTPSDATVSYSTDGGNTWTTTAPVRTVVGTTTVKYKISKTHYNDKTGSFSCTVNNGTMNASLAGNSRNYNGSALTCDGGTQTGVPSGSTITYSTTNGSGYSATKPTVTNVSDSKTIYYKITNSNYNDFTGSFSCTINKATMNASLAGNSKNYNGSAMTCDGGTQTGVPSGSTITYSTTNGSGYSTTKPTVTNVLDSKTIYYKITNPNYNDFTGSFSCTVAKAANPITISASSGSLPYSTNATLFTVSGNQGSVTVTSSKTAVATVTIANNTVSATTGASYGTTTITATAAGNNNYASGSKTYTLTVNKGTITLNNQGATTAGTGAIYQTYNTNVYLDSNRANAMTTSSNGITVPAKNFNVSYNANGGSVSPTFGTATYTFKGYYSATSGGTQYIGTNGIITSDGLNAGKGLTSNGTWYAQWTGGTVTLPTPTRTGHTFTGWNTKQDGSGTSYAKGATYTATANVTLYAQWSLDTYTITLNDGGSYGGMGSIKEVYGTKYTNASGTQITGATPPKRDGWVFEGYYTAATGGTRVIGQNGALPEENTYFTANTTLYAHWSQCTAGYYCPAGSTSVTQNKCTGRDKYSAAGASSCSTVTDGYYTAGCNAAGDACTSQTICPKGSYCSGGVKTLCPAGQYGATTGLKTNMCSGSCAAGYYCPAGSVSSTAYDCDTGTTTASSANIWTSNAGAGTRHNCYRHITLNKNGATGTISTSGLANNANESVVTASGKESLRMKCFYGVANDGSNMACFFPSTSTLSLTGYDISGWGIGVNSSGSSCVDSAVVTSMADSVTYYACKTPRTNQLSIDWDENGGKTLTNTTCTYGSNLTMPGAITHNTNSNMVFAGWLVHGNGNIYQANEVILGGCTFEYVEDGIQAQWRNTAGGYTCTLQNKYTSCESGYYLSDCGTSGWQANQTATGTWGNSCVTTCPTGYSCAGGATCPAPNTNTKYVVNHYTKNLEATTYTLHSTDNNTGTTAASVTLADLKKDITGFTYNKGFAGTSTKGTTMPSSGAETTTTILADGTRVIDLYYTRVITTITIDKNGGSGSLTVNGVTETDTTNVSFTCEYGASFTLPAWGGSNNALAQTKKVFTGWSKASPVTCGTADQTITAQWTTPTCTVGTGVNTTSLKEVTNNAPVCERSSKDGYYCSATQTGTAGATLLTVSCSPAGDGYYAKAGATNHTACAQGSYSEKTSASTKCLACPKGRTTSSTGTHYNATANTACSVTCSNASNAKSWADPSWSANTVTNLCTVSACKANTYYTAVNGTGYENTCSPCGSNSSTSDSNTSETCTCAPGHTNDGTVNGGSTSKTGCTLIAGIECASGQYLPGKATTCSACRAGNHCPSSTKTYSYNDNDQGISPCPEGMYQPQTGKTLCMEAQMGYYVPSEGAVEQLPCTGITYADEMGLTECKVCPTVTNNTANATTSYEYWNTGVEGDHTTVKGCNVKFTNVAATHGSMSELRCYADADAATSGEYGVDGTSKGCWVYWDKLTCDGGYYNANYSENSNYDFTNKTLSALKQNACVDVTSGYWSADDVLTREECPDGYSSGSDNGRDSEKSCYANITLNKNGFSGKLVSGTGCPVSGTTGTTNDTLKLYYNTACTLPTTSLTQTGYTATTGWAVSNTLGATAVTTIAASTSAPSVKTYYARKTTCAASYYKSANTTCSACSGLTTGGFYSKSSAGTASDNSVCFGTLTKGTYVAEAKTDPVSCEGGYCDSTADIYYGQTGGRSTLANWTCPGGADAASDCYRGVTLNKNGMSGALALPTESGCHSIGGTTGANNDTVYVYYNKACKLPTTALSATATGTTYTGTKTWATSANAASGFVSSITLTDTSSTTPVRYAGKMYTCSEGYYLKANTNGACTACSSPYYCEGITNKYYSANDQGRSACADLDSAKKDGTYTSVSPYNAATTCRFTQEQQPVTAYCATKTSNTMSYNSDGWPANTYKVTALPGSIIVNNNKASAACSQCTGATYSAGGTAITCSACDSNYTYNTDAGKSLATQCQTSCAPGTYVESIGGVCVNVGPGFWGAGGTVAYGSTSERTACSSGLTTIGYGVGANEEADCGRILHAGANQIYLRSAKRTSPAFHALVDGKTYYGNMVERTSAITGALMVRDKDGKLYSVENDNQ